MDATTLYVLLVAFLATLIKSTFGFGEGLVAVPLLAFILPIQVAAPLAVLLTITTATIVVIQDWKKIHLRSTGWLLAAALLGIPLGLALLTHIPPQWGKAVLAVCIALFSGYCLLGRKPPVLQDDSRRWLLGCGFLAGVMGSAFGMNSPPLVIYGSMRRWSPQHFRATLLGCFLPASLAAVGGYGASGLLTPTVTHYYQASLILVIPAIFLGRWINHRLRGDSFLKYVHVGLACIGVLLFTQALHQIENPGHASNRAMATVIPLSQPIPKLEALKSP